VLYAWGLMWCRGKVLEAGNARQGAGGGRCCRAAGGGSRQGTSGCSTPLVLLYVLPCLQALAGASGSSLPEGYRAR